MLVEHSDEPVLQSRVAGVSALHSVYFDRVVPRIGGLLSDASAYQYLPRSVEYLPEPDDLLRAVETGRIMASAIPPQTPPINRCVC